MVAAADDALAADAVVTPDAADAVTVAVVAAEAAASGDADVLMFCTVPCLPYFCSVRSLDIFQLLCPLPRRYIYFASGNLAWSC